MHRGTNWINAAPFFFKKDANIPAADKNPQLHRYTAGGEIGGPIIKDKLFGFAGYQHLHVPTRRPEMSFCRASRIERYQPNSWRFADITNNNWTASEGTSGMTTSSAAWSSNPVASRSSQ